MSWAVEEWKEGLSTRALQKIQELESQLDKLKKERQQRQFQLDSLEAALQKQKQKVENEKNEGATLKRENQSLMELCDNLEKAKQKISHELQVKESQVNYQAGQLNSGKKQIEKLEQELKRCKSELERSQQTLITGDLSFSGTPQKSFTASLTPTQNQNDSKFAELQEKYNKEVEERKRLEAELRASQIKKINQSHLQSTKSHREIARHQASSSVFSWQQEKAPSCPSSSNQETPLKRSFSTSNFPWEQETTPSHSGLRSEKKDFNRSFSNNSNNSPVIDRLKAQNQELCSRIKELEHILQVQEKEKKSHMNKLQETQLQLDKMKQKLNEKDNHLNKGKDELTRMTAQLDQAAAQYETVEQKVKKLSEELKCQRQNAESARHSYEQKVKEKEKEYLEELSRQQRSLHTLDQQCNQIKSKLNQELQQAKNDYNALQAELDKVTAAKQLLEHDFSELTQKLSRAEQALLATQSKENELRKNFEEVKKEKKILNCQFDQKLREIHQLEEELKTAKQFLKQSQNFAEEMKNKNLSQEAELKLLQEKLDKQDSSVTLEKLKLVIADMEKQQESVQDLLIQRENHIKELNNKIGKMEKETGDLQKVLGVKKRECEEIRKEIITFSQWKTENEQLVNHLESEREGLLNKINHLETSLKNQQVKSHETCERVRNMEIENEKYSIEIKNLRETVECKSATLEAQKKAYDELQQKADCSKQKYKKEIENMTWKITEFTNQIDILEQRLQLTENKVVEKDQCYQELVVKYDRICSVKSEDISEVTEDREVYSQNDCGSVLDDRQIAVSNATASTKEPGASTEDQENHFTKVALGTGKNSQQEVTVLQHQISSLEISLMAQKQLNSDLQKQYEELIQIKGQTEKRLFEVEQIHGSFVTETKQHISNLQEDVSARQDFVCKILSALEDKDKEFLNLNKELETRQAEIQDLKINRKMLEESVRQLQLMSETWNSEKKDMSTTICLYKEEIDGLIEKKATLQGINTTLEEEKVDLLKAHAHISNNLKEREGIISDMSKKHKEERLSLEKRYEEIERELTVLQRKYQSVEEKNANIESILRLQTNNFEERKSEIEEDKQLINEHKEVLSRLKLSEEKNRDLIQELEKLQSEFSHIQNVSSVERDCLRKEILHVRAEQNKVQEQYNILHQEREELIKAIETKNEHQICNLGLFSKANYERLKESAEEKERDLNKCQVKLELLQMDLEDKEVSVENYKTQVMQLEAALKSSEIKLEESEKEKEGMMQELEIIKEKLETPDAKLIVMNTNEHSEDFNGDVVSQYHYKKGLDENCFSGLHELTSSQNDDVQLVSSWQMTVNRINELEKMCEKVQIEKLALTTEHNESKTESVATTAKMAEVGQLMNEVKILKEEKAIFPDEFMDQNDEDRSEIQFNEPVSCKSLECNVGLNYDYEFLKLSEKEVKIHFVEIKEKLFSLQNQHKILHEQHCKTISQISELQSCIETLKAENSALSTSLNKVNTDLVQVTPLQNSGEFKSVGSKHIFSPLGLNEISHFAEESFVSSSFDNLMYKKSEDITHLNSSEESVLGGTTEISLVEELYDHALERIAQQDSITSTKSHLNSKIEELQTLCQTYKKSIKMLEDQFCSQENMKNEEIQELKQIILSERKEIDDLKKQNISDNDQWQQKLNSVTMEMEYKLAAEKKQTENLFLQLEVARLQLQGLDLSSRSLLCVDVEDVPPEEENGLQQLKVDSLPTENVTHESDTPDIRHCEQIAIEDIAECGKVTEITETRSTEKHSEKLPSERDYSYMSDKNTNLSDKTSDLSFSRHGLSETAVDFLENEVAIETLQQQVTQKSEENLKLLHGIQGSNEKADVLLFEIKELNSRLDLKETALTAKISVCTELEKTVLDLEKEQRDLKEKLESAAFDKQQLSCRGTTLEKELEKVRSDIEMYKVRLSDVTDMLDDLEKTKGEWQEKFLETENELKRTKSEKANVESHALALEDDIEVLQTKYQQLERDSENKLKTMSGLQEQLAVITAERNQLSEELSILRENKEELDQVYQKLQEKTKELESNKIDSTEFIRILEAEVKTLTKLLQTEKSNVSHLTKEKDCLLQQLEKNTEVLALEEQKLQSLTGHLNEEKELILKESEMLQTQLSASEMEKSKLSKSLEGLLTEKHELAARLNSAQEEVDQMRCGIEKLKIKIESDEKKKRHVAEKLRECEWKRDSLLDKVEKLERELQISEDNLEDAILRAETAKVEADTLNAEMGERDQKLKTLELEITDIQAEKEGLVKELKEKQEKIFELESSNSTVVKLLEIKEKENIKMRELQNVVLLVTSQLKDARLSYNEQEVCEAKGVDIINEVGCLEYDDKTQLLEELQEMDTFSAKLEQSVKALVQKLATYKQKLTEKIQENVTLQNQIKDTEQLSVQLLHLESEHEHWKEEKEGLQNLMAELIPKVQNLSNTETWQSALENLKISYKDLEKELESTRSEKTAFLEKVNELTENSILLEDKLKKGEEKIMKLQEELTTERNILVEQVQHLQEQAENNLIQLNLNTLEKAELSNSLDKVQKELEEKGREMKRELSEYQRRLHQMEKNHQVVLAETNKKNELEIMACQDKLKSLEQCISAQKLEMELLKSSKEELNNSVKEANQMLEGLTKNKVDNLKTIVQLKKEIELAHSKLQLCIESCKQVEQEKEVLQKQIVERDALLKKQNQTVADGASTEEMRLKLEELQESIEVKTKEADENLEKYCSLIVNFHKLEEANEMLKTQVSLLNAQLKPTTDVVVSNSPLLSLDNPVTVNDQPVTERSQEDSTRLSGKRRRSQEIKENGVPRSPIPEILAKKLKKGAVYQDSLSENREYQPEGLPEVVKKGFGDIPTGKISPYILRRTSLNLRTSPRLAAQSQRSSPSTQSFQKGRSDNLAELSKPTAGGSKSQKVNDALQCQAGTPILPMEPTSRSLCVNKHSMKAVAESSRESLETPQNKYSLRKQALPDKDEEENCRVQ
ncbi:centromere protein F [Alligator mississippiensis]|uniref:centromere protein F n=1 Tax=Alligator mississippiensis TaxID=8496 RepID=UPI002877FEE8|nr:centromere protein F [Alligator mississippiensis]XP_019338727.2 centromere protein F [Alligator mississippiensis]XP_059573837.1 centromere protein F [Alligator mississippiensis]